ncbi:E3 ubiquitin ligase RBR family [Parasponia andersonii]|uniref:E3 ubiquitin ligase RBR family n=1 Tax=Parasponia andersonii TaxID=3476 RepID=A0A2P5CMW2_PARAD|nr:E3 ubiquitin ligase RBR family [Parasponia andersonii]
MATSRTRDPNPNDNLDFLSLVSGQRRELMAAETFESDIDFAYRLQLQEALAASVAVQPSSSSSSSSSSSASASAAVEPTRHRLVLTQNEDAPRFASLQSEELARVEQEITDREQSAMEMRKVRVDLSRRIHDQKVARKISTIPEEDWVHWGDGFERPFGEGSSRSAIGVDSQDEDEEEDEAVFRVYFKGLVSEEKIGNEKSAMAGIGVAICDPRGNLVFELRKPLFGKGLSKLAAEAMALIEGLNAALALELKRVTLCCDNFTFHQFVSFLPSVSTVRFFDSSF